MEGVAATLLQTCTEHTGYYVIAICMDTQDTLVLIRLASAARDNCREDSTELCTGCPRLHFCPSSADGDAFDSLCSQHSLVQPHEIIDWDDNKGIA